MERELIFVSDLGKCPKRKQLENLFGNYGRGGIQYEAYRGLAVHKLFEEIAKSTNLERDQIPRILRNQILIPFGFKDRLKKELPSYQEKIKAFFLNDSLGKELFRSSITRLEEAIRVPMEQLGLSLQSPLEIQKKYSLSGKPDFRAGNKILEVKTTKSEKLEHKLQGYCYRKLATISEGTPFDYRLIYLGFDKPKVVKDPWFSSFWAKRKRENQIIQMIDKEIQNNEILRKNPFYKFEEKTEDCQWCPYFANCRTYSIVALKRRWLNLRK